MQDPKNDNYCLDITTQSIKATIDPLIPMIDGPRNDSVEVGETPKEELENLIVIDHSVEKNKGKGKAYEPVVQIISRPPLPFS